MRYLTLQKNRHAAIRATVMLLTLFVLMSAASLPSIKNISIAVLILQTMPQKAVFSQFCAYGTAVFRTRSTTR